MAFVVGERGRGFVEPRVERAGGDGGEFAAVTSGPLYARLNEAPSALADNEGHLTATITPARREQ